MLELKFNFSGRKLKRALALFMVGCLWVSSAGVYAQESESRVIQDQQTPGEQTPGEQTPGEQTPGEQTPGEVAPSEVKLNKLSMELTVGDTEVLKATVLPEDASNKNVTWATTNEKVVKVEDGTVTAVAKGTATITATSAVNDKLKATCEVTVKDAVVNVTGVTLSKSSVALKAGTTTKLTATVQPTNATDKNVTWSPDNSNEVLQFLAVTGILGVLSYFGLQISILCRCAKKIKEHPDFLVGVMAIAAFLAQGIVNSSQIFIFPLYFVFLGIIERKLNEVTLL